MISLKISIISKGNIWVDKLRQMIKEKLKHLELNNKEYISYLMKHDDINYKIPTSSNLKSQQKIKIIQKLKIWIINVNILEGKKAKLKSLMKK